MTLFEFAWKNISRDKRNYLYYFANCMCSVFVFFLFSMLSFHPALAVIDDHSTMGMILALGEAVAVVFSMCFISYSMKCFLKNRSQQLGLIIILGASKRQLNRLVFMENMMIGLFAIVGGILLGLVFSKFFLDLANALIGISDFVFYLPLKAMALTIVVMGLVFLAISYLTPKLLRKRNVLALFKAERIDDKPQKLLPVLGGFVVLAPLSLVLLCTKANWARPLQESILFPFLLMLAFVSGIYLLFSFGLRVGTAWQQRSTSTTRLLSVGDQRARLKTNAQSMTLSAVLYTVAFFAVIVLFSMSTNVKAETEKIFPYAMTYNTWTENADEAHDVALIERELQNLSGYDKVTINLWYPSEDSRTPVMAQSNYNQVMDLLERAPISLTEQGVYLVAGDADQPLTHIPEEVQTLLDDQQMALSIEGQTSDVITLTGFTNGICVVSDKTFDALEPSLIQKTVTAFTYDHWETNSASPEAVQAALATTLDNGDANLISAYKYYRSSQIQLNLGLYISGLLAVVFILAVASFVYARLYSDLDAECKKWKGIVKIGLSRKELTLVLNRFIFMILCWPFAVALSCSWIGILLLERFTLTSNIPVALSFTAVLLILQTLLYIWVKTAYRKTAFRSIYGD